MAALRDAGPNEAAAIIAKVEAIKLKEKRKAQLKAQLAERKRRFDIKEKDRLARQEAARQLLSIEQNKNLKILQDEKSTLEKKKQAYASYIENIKNKNKELSNSRS